MIRQIVQANEVNEWVLMPLRMILPRWKMNERYCCRRQRIVTEVKQILERRKPNVRPTTSCSRLPQSGAVLLRLRKRIALVSNATMSPSRGECVLLSDQETYTIDFYNRFLFFFHNEIVSSPMAPESACPSVHILLTRKGRFSYCS